MGLRVALDDEGGPSTRIRSAIASTLAVLALAVGAILSASAQDGSFADTGFPETALTLTDAGVEGLGAETTAGWNVVTLTNSVTATGDPFEDAWSVDFILLPDGRTADDVVAAFNAAFAGPPEGEASPPAIEGMDTGSPAAEAAPADPLGFLYGKYLAGGPGAPRGETTQSAIYLEPVDYAVLASVGAPATLTVTGEADAASPVATGATADATITETGASGGCDFVAASPPTGPAVLEILNESDQPHFIFAARSDVPFTADEVIALVSEEEPPTDAATPVAASPEAGAAEGPPVSPGFITGAQSPQSTQYVAVDLEPGYDILLTPSATR